jgi:hypothetical protein
MDDRMYVYATAALIVGLVLSQAMRRSFDPFAPIWLFLVGYLQVYVVQAISYREWAIRVRGEDLVTQANARALWALAWFLAVYYSGVGRWVASLLPRPPVRWSSSLITGSSAAMILWGLLCTGLVGGSDYSEMSGEESLLRSFPILMLVGGILLIVTGRYGGRSRPGYTWAGLGVVALYVLIWMFNGKRSQSLFGVLTSVCAFYTSRGTRPSKPVLLATALAGALVVSLAINWRNDRVHDRSFSGFVDYLSDFDPSSVLVDLNLKEREEAPIQKPELASKETEEYGGFLLMMDTVPYRSDYNYGSSYLRIFSTYIPRLVWHDKPIYGRQQWEDAWIAGSEFKRKRGFTGPSIGILGATQLNGGAAATAIVLAALALLLRTSYEFFRRYSTVAWVQAWWALTFYNAWLMTVNDDPFVWYYYIYGHTTLPPMVMLWFGNKFGSAGDPGTQAVGVPAGGEFYGVVGA